MSEPLPPALLSALPPSAVPAFTPVPVKTRSGWTAGKQGIFIETLTASGSVRLSTEACGMTQCSVYKLRHRPGAESFARAWDEAVEIAARRVRDVLLDQAINGVPERVLIGRDTVVERRRFNHRTMIWVLQHHMPDRYPGASTTHRRGWTDAHEDGSGEAPTRKLRPWERPEPSIEEVRENIMRKVEAMARPRMRAIAADPAKRAAYELLNGPADWAALTGRVEPEMVEQSMVEPPPVEPPTEAGGR